MQSGLSRLLSESDIGLPVIRSNNLINGKLDVSEIKYWYKEDNQGANTKSYYLRENDLLVNFINSLAQIGKVAKYFNILNRDVIFTTNLMRLRFKENIDSDFIFSFFQTNNYSKYIYSITKPAVNQASFTTKDFNKLPVNLPSKQEQEKIASFLTSIDTKIEQLTKKEELLQQYKKGVMQKIFNQEIRFPPKGTSSQAQGEADDGSEFCEWEEKKLSQIAIKKNIKNKDNSVNTVLTNSAEHGIVNQQDYFDKDIANQNNLEGYYIVEKDDFIYNPRISSFAPVGPMKRNKLGQGVMSPLYTVLELQSEYRNFYELYFETTLWYRYMNQIANFGARHDRMNVTNKDFIDIM